MDKAIVVTVPVVAQGRAQRREAAGRPARLRHPRNPGGVSAGRTFPSTSTWTSASSMLHGSIRVRELATGRRSGRRSPTATRCSCTSSCRRPRESATAAADGGARRRGRGRARGHQEGQDRQGRRGRQEGQEGQTVAAVVRLIVGSGQSREANTGRRATTSASWWSTRSRARHQLTWAMAPRAGA